MNEKLLQESATLCTDLATYITDVLPNLKELPPELQARGQDLAARLTALATTIDGSYQDAVEHRKIMEIAVKQTVKSDSINEGKL